MGGGGGDCSSCRGRGGEGGHWERRLGEVVLAGVTRQKGVRYGWSRESAYLLRWDGLNNYCHRYHSPTIISPETLSKQLSIYYSKQTEKIPIQSSELSTYTNPSQQNLLGPSSGLKQTLLDFSRHRPNPPTPTPLSLQPILAI